MIAVDSFLRALVYLILIFTSQFDLTLNFEWVPFSPCAMIRRSGGHRMLLCIAIFYSLFIIIL